MAPPIRAGLALFSLLILCSCTRPVERRRLPESAPARASKLLLDDDLSAADVKELLEAINEAGDLEEVAHYWREPTEAELDQWGNWLTQFVTHSSGDPRGLVAVLDRFNANRRFSALEKDLRDWREEPAFFDQREFLYATLDHPDFDELFKRDYRLLNPAIWSSWSKTWKDVDFRVLKPKFKVEGLVEELDRILKPELRQSFENVLTEATKKHAVPSLFDTAKFYRENYQLLAFAVLDVGLNRMLAAPPVEQSGDFSNQLEQLVAFTASANQSTHGLFAAIETKLKEDPGSEALVTEEISKWAIDSLSEVDTENALEGAHRVLALLPASLFRSVKKLLLERFHLGTMDALERQQILGNFPEPEQKPLRAMLRQWFDSVQSVAALDHEDIAHGPTLFVAYRDLLRRTAAEDVGWLSSFYQWAHSGKFFVIDPDGKPHSPFWADLIQQGQGVQLLRTVAYLPEDPRVDFREAIQEALVGSDSSPRAGVQLHLAWLKRAFAHRAGFTATLQKFFDSESKNPFLLEEDDWKFVERFAQESGQKFPRRFFSQHSDRKTAFRAVASLRKLAETGKLARPIALLRQVDHPSIQRISDVLQRWEASGELAAALRTLELFFAEPDSSVAESGLEKRQGNAYFDPHPGGFLCSVSFPLS